MAQLTLADEQLTDLSHDELALILFHLPLAHDIALAGLTCHALCAAAKLALKARPFSSEVVTLVHTHIVNSVAAALDGRIITVPYDHMRQDEPHDIKVWLDGACERTIQAHTLGINAVAVIPRGARFVSVSDDGTAKLWTLDGALERTFEVGSYVTCVAALPDGAHFVVGTRRGPNNGEFRLYHVDGTLVHTFKGHRSGMESLTATPDGQHIIGGGYDLVGHSSKCLVKVWSVVSKSVVSTCAGHTGNVYAVAAMPDGERFLSASNDRTVRVWLLNGTHQNTFSKLHQGLGAGPRGASR